MVKIQSLFINILTNFSSRLQFHNNLKSQIKDFCYGRCS